MDLARRQNVPTTVAFTLVQRSSGQFVLQGSDGYSNKGTYGEKVLKSKYSANRRTFLVFLYD